MLYCFGSGALQRSRNYNGIYADGEASRAEKELMHEESTTDETVNNYKVRSSTNGHGLTLRLRDCEMVALDTSLVCRIVTV